MGLKDRILGHVVDHALRHERAIRRALSRRSGVDVFLQLDDAHGLLLVQLLSQLVEDGCREELRVHVVPPPEAEADPEPELRRIWTIADARLVAAHRGLEGPAIATPPPREVVEKAQRVLLVERSGVEPLELALEVLRRVWADDRSGLDDVAREHGELPPGELAPRLDGNAALLRRLGHYQGSMVLHRGEWFWGVDRFELLERSLGRSQSMLRWADTVDVPPGVVGPDGRVRMELFFSFRSPYSYLVLEPLRRIAARPRVDLVIRPVLPMVMRGLPVPRSKRLYILRDCKRVALELGAPFGKICDPVGQGVERCLAVFPEADAAGCSEVFVREVATAIWSEAANMTSDAELRRVVERSGLSWSAAQRGLAEEERWRAMAQDNRAALFEAGLWGVPTLRVGELAFWGQDRIPILERTLDAAGVEDGSPRS